MVNQQELVGHWNEIRGKIQERWAKLTDDDLRSFNGNIDQLVGRIQQTTGETREAIERFLDQFAAESSQFMEDARERVQQAASQVNDQVRQGIESARQGYAEAERVVQQRPGQAMAIAFGVGLLAGVGVTLLLRQRAQESDYAQGRVAAEHIGRQMLNAFAGALPEAMAKKARG
jgi:uncharacterized protein YjbJ (UPF0337 family)